MKQSSSTNKAQAKRERNKAADGQGPDKGKAKDTEPLFNAPASKEGTVIQQLTTDGPSQSWKKLIGKDPLAFSHKKPEEDSESDEPRISIDPTMATSTGESPPLDSSFGEANVLDPPKEESSGSEIDLFIHHPDDSVVVMEILPASQAGSVEPTRPSKETTMNKMDQSTAGATSVYGQSVHRTATTNHSSSREQHRDGLSHPTQVGTGGQPRQAYRPESRGRSHRSKSRERREHSRSNRSRSRDNSYEYHKRPRADSRDWERRGVYTYEDAPRNLPNEHELRGPPLFENPPVRSQLPTAVDARPFIHRSPPLGTQPEPGKLRLPWYHLMMKAVPSAKFVELTIDGMIYAMNSPMFFKVAETLGKEVLHTTVETNNYRIDTDAPFIAAVFQWLFALELYNKQTGPTSCCNLWDVDAANCYGTVVYIDLPVEMYDENTLPIHQFKARFAATKQPAPRDPHPPA